MCWFGPIFERQYIKEFNTSPVRIFFCTCFEKYVRVFILLLMYYILVASVLASGAVGPSGLLALLRFFGFRGLPGLRERS